MIRIARILLYSSLFASSAVFAFNLLFLKDAPVAEFDSIDTGLMLESFYHAMDNNDDGVSEEWVNEDSGHHGSVTPLDQTSVGTTTCRRVKVENHATVNSGISEFKFCKEDGNKWLISE